METNKTILITGSNAGIGKLTAKYFADRGWKVAATMRSVGKAGDLADHPNIRIYTLDVTATESVREAVRSCLKDCGKIDVVVNNAGFGVYGPCELATEKQIDLQYDVNVKGVIRVMKAVLPHFREKQSGLFINISSVAGLITYPLGSLYNSSKWALEGLTEGMSFELKPLNIRVKLVEPGSFGTNFQQVGLIWTENQEIRDYDAINHHIQSMRKNIQDKLADPIAVAEKIWEAANDPSDRMRYLVGKDALSLVARRDEIGSDAFIEELGNKMLRGM
ncbi:MAG: SDR family oxidoreductase [Bacteroidota bacterium]